MKLGPPSPLSGHGDDGLVAINPHDRSRWADQLSSEQRDVAGTAAQVENPHALADPRAPKEPLGDRPHDRRLVHQPLDLSS
jgi:hypothetical protein